jgi:hypothetical protein
VTRDTIDKDWIEVLRKTWKKWVQEASRQEPHLVEDFLKRWGSWLVALAKDLAFAKGFFTFLRKDKNPGQVYILKTKVFEHLKSIGTVIGKGASAANFWDQVVTPGTQDFKMGGGHRQALLEPKFKALGGSPSSLAEVDALAQANPRVVESALNEQLRAIMEEVVERADKEFSRQFLALLTKTVNKHGPLSFGTHEREVNISNVRVVMEDIPSLSPQEPGDLRHPSQIQRYVPLLQEAEMLLRAKGLGFLWYGTIFIKCKTCAGPNQHGPQYTTAAHYVAAKDHVVIFTHPSPELPRFIAHELGHRYYYKFMTQADRARFAHLFGEVPAVSDYGSKAVEEDFAEVFAHYVDGRDLTPDQLRRFKAFLGRARQASAKSRIASQWIAANAPKIYKTTAEALVRLWTGQGIEVANGGTYPGTNFRRRQIPALAPITITDQGIITLWDDEGGWIVDRLTGNTGGGKPTMGRRDLKRLVESGDAVSE